MREDGYFIFRGRAKDMIIRGGENIYPREVEEFLYTNPKIADIAVVGLPDERLGEIVCAWITLKSGQTATEEEIQDFCRNKSRLHRSCACPFCQVLTAPTVARSMLAWLLRAISRSVVPTSCCLGRGSIHMKRHVLIGSICDPTRPTSDDPHGLSPWPVVGAVST